MLQPCEDEGLNKNETERKIMIYVCADDGFSKTKEIRKVYGGKPNCREGAAELSSRVSWLIYKTGDRGDVTGQVMVRNSLKDFFVSQVRHPFASFSFLFCLLFLTPLFLSLLFFFCLLSWADTCIPPSSLAEGINLNHGEEWNICLGSAREQHLWAGSSCVLFTLKPRRSFTSANQSLCL